MRLQSGGPRDCQGSKAAGATGGNVDEAEHEWACTCTRKLKSQPASHVAKHPVDPCDKRTTQVHRTPQHQPSRNSSVISCKQSKLQAFTQPSCRDCCCCLCRPQLPPTRQRGNWKAMCAATASTSPDTLDRQGTLQVPSRIGSAARGLMEPAAGTQEHWLERA